MFKEFWKKIPIIYKTLALFIIIGIISALVNWYKPSPLNPSTYVTAPTIPAVATVPKIKIPIKEIQVIPKEIANKKLPDLPEEIKVDSSKEITGTATTGPSKTGFNVITTVDKNDGSTSILYKEKPRSLFEFVNEKSVGLAYGVTTNKGQQLLKLNGEYTFLRVGEVFISAETEIKMKQLENMEGSAYIKATYKW